MANWFLACIFAFLTSLVATRLVINARISDNPDQARKLHKKVTPTSGGLGILAGIGVALIVAVVQKQISLESPVFDCFLACASGCLLGLVDDVRPLKPSSKFIALAAIISAFVVFGYHIQSLYIGPSIHVALGPVIGCLGTAFWLFVLVNTINFMDGANGMSMGCSAIGLVGLAILLGVEPNLYATAPSFAALSLIGAASCCGFLVWNAGLGRIFAGDAGALCVGLLCGTLGTLTVLAGVNALSVAMCFLPMLTDVILTIVARLRRKENILTAHATHLYQIIIRSGVSHFKVSFAYWIVTSLVIVLAWLGQTARGNAPLFVFVVCLAGLVVVHCHQTRIYSKRLKN